MGEKTFFWTPEEEGHYGESGVSAKKRGGIGIEKLSNREKAMVIGALASSYPIQQLLATVHMAKSSFFYQRNAMKKDKYAAVRAHLHTAYKKGRGCYGYRRLRIVLTAGGEILAQKVVLRLMHEEQRGCGQKVGLFMMLDQTQTAYSRIPVDSDELMQSLAAQVSHYSTHIQANP